MTNEKNRLKVAADHKTIGYAGSDVDGFA